MTTPNNTVVLSLRLEGPKGSEELLRNEAKTMGYNVSRVKQRDDVVQLYATKSVDKIHLT